MAAAPTLIANKNIAHSGIDIKNVNFIYNKKQVLHNISLKIEPQKVVAIIGPSGCGKTTLLGLINRINDTLPKTKFTGQIFFRGQDIYQKGTDLVDLRTNIGMIFQRPTPFPISIYDNVAFGLRHQGIRDPKIISGAVIDALKKASLWDEVKDNLQGSALALSGGQQQRLCIARAISLQPSVLLFDEPTSALDPIATLKIEALIKSLKKYFTIVIVTHDMEQAMRVSDFTAFLLKGNLIEYGPTKELFMNPHQKETRNYITGRFENLF